MVRRQASLRQRENVKSQTSGSGAITRNKLTPRWLLDIWSTALLKTKRAADAYEPIRKIGPMTLEEHTFSVLESQAKTLDRRGIVIGFIPGSEADRVLSPLFSTQVY